MMCKARASWSRARRTKSKILDRKGSGRLYDEPSGRSTLCGRPRTATEAIVQQFHVMQHKKTHLNTAEAEGVNCVTTLINSKWWCKTNIRGATHAYIFFNSSLFSECHPGNIQIRSAPSDMKTCIVILYREWSEELQAESNPYYTQHPPDIVSKNLLVAFRGGIYNEDLKQDHVKWQQYIPRLTKRT